MNFSSKFLTSSFSSKLVNWLNLAIATLYKIIFINIMFHIYNTFILCYWSALSRITMVVNSVNGQIMYSVACHFGFIHNHNLNRRKEFQWKWHSLGFGMKQFERTLNICPNKYSKGNTHCFTGLDVKHL